MNPSLYTTIQSKIANGDLILPTLPEVAIDVLRAFDNPNVSAGQISNILTKDPSIAARIMKMANSAYLSSPTKIKDLKQAIVRIGLTQIRNVVAAIAIEQLFVCRSDKIKIVLRGMYEESIRVACAAMAVHMNSKFQTKIPIDSILLLSLLHNIGYLPILKEADSEGMEDVETEAVSRVIVKKLTIMILEAWNFDFYTADVSKLYEVRNWTNTEITLSDFITAGSLMLTKHFARPEGPNTQPLIEFYNASIMDEGKTLDGVEVVELYDELRKVFV